MSNTSYYFASSARQGLAAAIQGAATEHRATIDVILTAKARDRSTGNYVDPDNPISQTVSLLGPGDILGFHERVVARQDPKPDVGDFEPNYFPSLEFTDADFLWRFTADRAAVGGLTPWVTLIVLASDPGNGQSAEFNELEQHNDELPPAIATTIGALPNLQLVSRWAHVQVSAEQGKSNQELLQQLTDEPEDAVCRLICPRRLAPQTGYDAFVVPTFRLGVLAGLGQEIPDNANALDLAWEGDNASTPVELPYYYRWQFRTGVRGDFEHLVRLLEPRALTGLGLRDIDTDSPGFGVAAAQRTDVAPERASILEAEGALRSLDIAYSGWGKDSAEQPANLPEPTQVDIADLINRSDVDRALDQLPSVVHTIPEITNISVVGNPTGDAVAIHWQASGVNGAQVVYWLDENDVQTVAPNSTYPNFTVELEQIIPTKTYRFRIVATLPDGTDVETPECQFEVPLPTVTPPIYGRWHYGRRKSGSDLIVDPDDQDAWIDQLNLDPRHRVAAGLGARAIRKEQEHLMASAWDQLGSIDQANDVLRRSQFGRDSSGFLHKRFDALRIEDFLRITRPVHTRVRTGSQGNSNRETVFENLNGSRIPEAAFDPAMRRILRPRGPIRKKRQRAGQSTDLLRRLAAGSLEIATARPKPHGTLRMCDITRRLEDELPDVPVPTVSLSASPTTVGPGQTSTITWSSEYATTCVASGSWSGNKAADGSEVVGPFGTNGGSGVIVGGVSLGSVSLGGASGESQSVAGYTVEAWGRAPMTASTHRTPRTRVSRLASGTTTTLGQFVLNMDSRRMDEVTGDVYFRVYDADGNLVVNTEGTQSWDPYFPGSVSINVGNGSENPADGIDVPVTIPYPFTLTCTGPGGQASTTVIVTLTTTGGGIPDNGNTVTPGIVFYTTYNTYQYTRFCDGEFNCSDFTELPDVQNPVGVRNAVCTTLDEWLDIPPAEEAEPPRRGSQYLRSLRDLVHSALDPAITMVARAKQRLRLGGDLTDRFEVDYEGDPLDPIFWSPTFPQPMYEALRDISHDLLLPGVSRIPPNTLGLLNSNRRFLESYMCGCNHEFAGELLWRGYPTDQRGSYFRQFWDVDEFVPSQELEDQLYNDWQSRPTTLGGRAFRENLIIKHDDIEVVVAALSESQVGTLASEILLRRGEHIIGMSVEDRRRVIIEDNNIGLAVRTLADFQLYDVLRQVVVEIELEEWLKDVTPLTGWGENVLGENRTKDTDMLILVVRGDLLRRYPGALIYSVDAVHNDGIDGPLVPALREYITPAPNGPPAEDIIGGIVRQFPVFKGTLPADLTFFGFAFDQDEAMTGGAGQGKAFVIEERVTDARFGLDMPADPPVDLETWNDLSWSHVGFGVAEGTQRFGAYLDYAWGGAVTPSGQNDQPWNLDSSAAKTARITCQKPVRIAVHASQMIP